MTITRLQPRPELLPKRLDDLSGIDTVREALAGVPAYLVGGGVRDLLLGLERADVDIAIEDPVDAVAARLGGEMRAHERFATASVRLDALEVDLARTRAETYERPGALPEVRPAGIEDDLARRDFTINAMAVPISGQPELIDPHGGLDDLGAGLLRVLHERSFVDDPTRGLRAARYAARYGLELDPRTHELLAGADLSTVSADRVRAELRKLAGEPDPTAGLRLLLDWGLADADAELPAAVAKLLDTEPWRGVADRADAVLAAASVAAGRYRGPTEPLEAARKLVAVLPERPSVCVRAARDRSGVELALARALGAEWLDRYVADWRHVRLEIGGEDLLAAGVPEGPGVGRGLEAALNAKLDGEVTNRDDELRIALAAARAPEGT
jgi:tRNA nucleotidyltransferase (CCA-adding enzyme)